VKHPGVPLLFPVFFLPLLRSLWSRTPRGRLDFLRHFHTSRSFVVQFPALILVDLLLMHLSSHLAFLLLAFFPSSLLAGRVYVLSPVSVIPDSAYSTSLSLSALQGRCNALDVPHAAHERWEGGALVHEHIVGNSGLLALWVRDENGGIFYLTHSVCRRLSYFGVLVTASFIFLATSLFVVQTNMDFYQSITIIPQNPPPSFLPSVRTMNYNLQNVRA
jgi:hypothetical protein